MYPSIIGLAFLSSPSMLLYPHKVPVPTRVSKVSWSTFVPLWGRSASTQKCAGLSVSQQAPWMGEFMLAILGSAGVRWGIGRNMLKAVGRWMASALGAGGWGEGGRTRIWHLCRILTLFLGITRQSQAAHIWATSLGGTDPSSQVESAVPLSFPPFLLWEVLNLLVINKLYLISYM